ncbi:MAG: TRAP transporter small permease subunit [Spirochaetales bacterium]|nr:TRAP transporter small permease subunit [Spirochaetales bacterium]
MTKIIQKIMDVIHIASIVLAIACLSTQIIVITINVVLRLFSMGFSQMEEISTNMMMPAITFLSMAIGVKLGLHINVDLFPKSVPKIFTVLLEKMKYILMAGIGGVIFYYSIIKMSLTNGIFSSMPFLPLMLQYIFLPLAGLLITLDSIFFLFELKLDHEFIDRNFLKIGAAKTDEEITGEENHG